MALTGKQMDIRLGLRALALVAVVVASTAMLARPGLVSGAPGDAAPALATMLALGQH
jgi:hypothetical protein